MSNLFKNVGGSDSGQLHEEAKLLSQNDVKWSKAGDVIWRLQVPVLEHNQMVWPLLRAMFSQTSQPRWLTFGPWVTHPCFILNPETITVTPLQKQTLHHYLWFRSTTATLCPRLSCLSLIWLRPLILAEIHFTLSAVSANNTHGSVGRWCCNYGTFVRLLKVFPTHCSSWGKLYFAVLFSLSLTEIINMSMLWMKRFFCYSSFCKCS